MSFEYHTSVWKDHCLFSQFASLGFLFRLQLVFMLFYRAHAVSVCIRWYHGVGLRVRVRKASTLACILRVCVCGGGNPLLQLSPPVWTLEQGTNPPQTKHGCMLLLRCRDVISEACIGDNNKVSYLIEQLAGQTNTPSGLNKLPKRKKKNTPWI